MARQSRQTAALTRKLIEADARGCQELLELERDLQQGVQTERASLDRQHEAFEAERRQQARSRRRESLLSSALLSAALIISAVLPLVLSGILLWRLGPPERATVLNDLLTVLNDLLIEELVTECPRLLPLTEASSEQTAEH